jgi:regulator of protease activity HflC (stomatin/prohibitin superfamily)
MATITPESATRDGELRLADSDPEIKHSASNSDRFVVKFTLEGVHLLELQKALEPRLAGIGVEGLHRFGMTVSLSGVEQGREAEVYAEIQAAIEEVNQARSAARQTAEHERSASEAAAAVSEARLQAVGESFRAARRSV